MNIYDIARLAEVSPATVSRVINNNPSVRSIKRERVLAILRKHNYVPSLHAQNLAGNSTKTVAVLTEDIRHINFSIIAYEVEQQATALGYNVFLCNTSRNSLKQQKYLGSLASKKVDCLILLGAAFCNEHVYSELNEKFTDIPKILYNSLYEGPNAYHITGRIDIGITNALEYLYSLGHRNIAYLQDDDNWITDNAARVFWEKAKEMALPMATHAFYKTRSGFDQGMAAVQYFEENSVKYSAIIGCDDLTAMGVVKQLNLMGKRVPEDVSVIGRFNSIYAKICTPALTTSDNRISTIAQTISEVMHCALIKRSIPNKSEVIPVLLVRKSTCPPFANIN